MLQPVIICGGEGKRLWPVSRKKLPKQFLNLFSGESLFELTLKRVKNITNARPPIIVTSKIHENIVKNIIKKVGLVCKILLEPEGKGTAPAIYLAAKEADETDVLLILPSDHFIEDNKYFTDIIGSVEKTILEDHWYIFVVEPSFASTDYGYVKTSKNKNKSNGISMKKFLGFVEKPSLTVAKEMVLSGDYSWSSGIFMGKSKKIINSIELHSSIIAKECHQVFKNRKIDNKNNIVNFDINLFSNIFANSIDYAVLEKEKNIKCIDFNTKWSDLGSWDSFLEYLDNLQSKNHIIEIKGSNSFLNLDNRIIGTVGVKDLIIIDTKEATLITKKGYSKDLPDLISALENKNLNLSQTLSHDERPWGCFDVLLDDKKIKVKKILIKPKQSLSLQYHMKRSEHWVIVSGIAEVYINGIVKSLGVGTSINIPKKAHHYVKNNHNKDLIIIEVQLGEYFGEDDIIRLKDPYNRV